MSGAPSGLLESVYQFMMTEGHKKTASAFAKEAKIDTKKASLTEDKLSDIFSSFKRKSDTANGAANKKSKAASSDSDSSSSSDSDSDSDSDDDNKNAPAPAAATKAKAGSDSDSSSSSDSDSDSDKEETTKPAAASKPADDDSSSSSSDSDSDSDDEADKKKSAPAAAKKEADASSDSDSSSSSSSSSDSDSDDDKPAPAKKAKTTAAASPEASGKTYECFVKGLPWKAEEWEVSDYFKDCGSGPTNVTLPVGADGRSSGTAIVTFDSEEGFQAACAKHEQYWPNTERWLSIQENTARGGGGRTPERAGVKPDGCDTVFVGNLAWEIDEDTMRATFADCGDVKQIRFATDKETGDFRGFGHVQFYDGNCTEAAVAMAGTEVLGRAIRVDYAPPREGGGSPRGDSPRGGRGGGRGGRGGGRGDGGRGGRGGRGFGPAPTFNKNKGSIAAASGKVTTFDDDSD